jgi:hypothetical protein
MVGVLKSATFNNSSVNFTSVSQCYIQFDNQRISFENYPNQTRMMSGHAYMCAKGIYFASVSTILQLDFRTSQESLFVG